MTRPVTPNHTGRVTVFARSVEGKSPVLGQASNDSLAVSASLDSGALRNLPLQLPDGDDPLWGRGAAAHRGGHPAGRLPDPHPAPGVPGIYGLGARRMGPAGRGNGGRAGVDQDRDTAPLALLALPAHR